MTKNVSHQEKRWHHHLPSRVTLTSVTPIFHNILSFYYIRQVMFYEWKCKSTVDNDWHKLFRELLDGDTQLGSTVGVLLVWSFDQTAFVTWWPGVVMTVEVFLPRHTQACTVNRGPIYRHYFTISNAAMKTNEFTVRISLKTLSPATTFYQRLFSLQYFSSEDAAPSSNLICTVCGRRCAALIGLTAHMRTHSRR